MSRSSLFSNDLADALVGLCGRSCWGVEIILILHFTHFYDMVVDVIRG